MLADRPLSEFSTNHLIWWYKELKFYGSKKDKNELKTVKAELSARDDEREHI